MPVLLRLLILLLTSHAAARAVSFRAEVAPLLQRRCAACHNEDSAKGGYRLDSFAMLQRAGDGGDAPVVAGSAEKSHLYRVLIAHDAEDRMPQKADALPESEIALLRRWLDEGAAYDGGEPSRLLAELAREQHLRPAPLHYPRAMPITALAFDGDGRRLAVSGYREVTLWDTASGTLARRVGGLPERITALAWNPQRNLLAIAGGTPGQWGAVALVEPSADYRVRILCDLPEVALCVAFSHDGETLVAGSGDRTLRTFDTTTGKQTRVLRQHADWVQSLALSPSGKLLVTASRDRTARVLDFATGAAGSTFTDHTAPLLAAAFLPDSRVITTARDGRALIWKPNAAQTHDELTELGGETRQLAPALFGIAAACADGAVRLYQTGDKRPFLTLLGHGSTVQAVTVSPCGDLIASGDASGEVILWSLACGTWLNRFVASPK